MTLVEQYAPRKPPPEERLPMGVLGGIIFSIGFFWFGWSSYPSISYWVPLLSGLAFGVSLMFLFVSFPLFRLFHRIIITDADTGAMLFATVITIQLYDRRLPI